MNQILFATRKKINLNRWKAILACLFLLTTCTVGHAQDAKVGSVAVMPFIKGEHPENIGETLNCPFAAICFENTDISPGAEERLTFMLNNILSDKLKEKLLPMDRVNHMYEAMKIDNETDTPAIFAQKLGKLLDAQYVAVGNVWRYKNRTGTALATDRPSSVAFSIYLIDIEKHELAWSATYDETQQALTENLLNALDFFKQGAKWLTADELAEYGMKKILKTFPLQ